ncbi:hypothetical protein EJ04DRAFT_597289 [Polyplosphaeria fusca]|uniref:Gfd2/YDR514C-like C-terminal domain-containing protein n=1 Tax=Polyplosphaeria fusca TaxID=682080 RepID=A0A9P4UU52_9PLEO|nr:hypothetical protein EJ04DRAFT_597289 [Polyplosphaeria fusca]
MAPTLSREDGRQTVAQALQLGEQTPNLDCIFVSIDTESLSYIHKKHPLRDRLSELGEATLDTRDIQDLHPGKNGAAWLSKTRAKHYLVSDCKNERFNHKDSRGKPLYQPNRFEFGNSIIIDRDELLHAFTKDLYIPDDTASKTGATIYRNIILVVHNTSSERKTLQTLLGLDIDEIETVSAIVDTEQLEREGLRKPALHSLCLNRLNCVPPFMHNGANDAVYTLGVMVMAALWRHAWEKQEKSGDWSFMSVVFPKWRVNGIEAIKALQHAIAEDTGGRCARCARYGHVEENCDGDELLIDRKTSEDTDDACWLATAEKLVKRVGEPVILKLRTV